jgi:CRISPR-associated exonuclease Cas4
MISALNHYLYCPRRCALVHVEQAWSENLYTMRGNDTHEHVDEISSHELAGVRYERALPIWSERLNLVGKADLVEFHGDIPYPVEYKSGRHKEHDNDFIQLCAQALCLEEMFGVQVERGALFWHGSRERKEVVFTDALRKQVEAVAASVHELLLGGRPMPSPVNDKRCDKCSLNESCLPRVVAEKVQVRRALQELFTVEEGN